MYRLLLFPLLLSMACQPTEANSPVIHENPATHDELLQVQRQAQQQLLRQKVDSLKKELPAWLKRHRFNENMVIIADLSMHSGLPRMLVLQLPQGHIIDSGLVAHGSGGTQFSATARFSNQPNSYCSSLGKYKIGSSYMGSFGLAFKLHGLDATNSNAYKRFVVLHAYDGVPDNPIFPDMLCNSLGCPMVSYAFLDRLKKRIKASELPTLLWIIN